MALKSIWDWIQWKRKRRKRFEQEFWDQVWVWDKSNPTEKQNLCRKFKFLTIWKFYQESFSNLGKIKVCLCLTLTISLLLKFNWNIEDSSLRGQFTILTLTLLHRGIFNWWKWYTNGRMPWLTVIIIALIFTYYIESLTEMEMFFKRCPGRGANLGSFWFSFILSHNCSALDHSATAPPYDGNGNVTMVGLQG